MSYLLDSDYFLIIKNAIEIKTGKIEKYFFSQYLKYIDTNSDFVSRLEVNLIDLGNQLNELKEVQITNMSIVEEKTKGAVITDFRTQFDWHNHNFFYFEGRLDNHYILGDAVALTEKKLLELNLGATKFLELINKQPKEKKQQTQNRIKLNWVIDDKQLYYVLRQLVNDHKAIIMTYPQIAEFIKQNVIGFENKNLATMTTALSRNLEDPLNLPKNKRVKVKIDETEKK